MPRIRIDQSNEIVQSRGENTVRIDVVVISFQFSTFVSLMQQARDDRRLYGCCD